MCTLGYCTCNVVVFCFSTQFTAVCGGGGERAIGGWQVPLMSKSGDGWMCSCMGRLMGYGACHVAVVSTSLRRPQQSHQRAGEPSFVPCLVVNGVGGRAVAGN